MPYEWRSLHRSKGCVLLWYITQYHIYTMCDQLYGESHMASRQQPMRNWISHPKAQKDLNSATITWISMEVYPSPGNPWEDCCPADTWNSACDTLKQKVQLNHSQISGLYRLWDNKCFVKTSKFGSNLVLAIDT